MHWCRHFFWSIRLEEGDSPPWGGWCPSLVRGGALGILGQAVFFFNIGFVFGTPFFVWQCQYSRQKNPNLTKILEWAPYPLWLQNYYSSWEKSCRHTQCPRNARTWNACPIGHTNMITWVSRVLSNCWQPLFFSCVAFLLILVSLS